MKFTKIYIIYNPKSTGGSEALATELQKVLQKNLTGTTTKCIPTKHAGHAQELAYEIAKTEERPLIISSSGDGGYHEVVNGVMQAKNLKAICAVLPSGNANDHSRTMQDKPLVKAILEGNSTRIDLLKVVVGSTEARYAHSYVGLGLTPVVATELNRHTLNAFRETLIVLKVFFKYRPFKIRVNGKILRLDSLIFGNINQMAKILTLAPHNRPDDGQFEIIIFQSGEKWKLIKALTKAAVYHLEKVNRARKYEFAVIKNMPMQMDGEVMKLNADDKILIESAHKALLTIA